MSFRAAFRPHMVLPLALGTVTSVLIPPQPAFAEERKSRKPIYDDPTPVAAPPPPESSTPANPPHSPTPNPPESNPSDPLRPTPTDRLTIQIHNARLKLYDYSLEAEKSLNAFMKRAFTMEKDFTHTVASLAPPADSNEAVVPGLIYVFVATLAGSIVTRNRGVIFRAGVPLAFGATAAYAALPLTMRNVEDLYGRYESRYPELQAFHNRMNEQTRYIWETGKAHTAMTVQRGEDLLDEARKKMEDWVRQGR